MSVDELKHRRPHSLRAVNPGTDQVKGMADRDKTEATFHCGHIVNADIEGIGFDPGKELRLKQTDSLFPSTLATLGGDQSQDDKLLETSRFPDTANVTVRISIAIWD